MADQSTATATVDRPIGQLTSAGELNKKVGQYVQERKQHEEDWQIALNFHNNKQYIARNRYTRRLERQGTEPGEIPPHMVRLVHNEIKPNARKLLALLTKTKPTFYATPGSASSGDRKAAQLSEKLLDSLWNSLGLKSKLYQAEQWAILCGQGWWRISWDATAGKRMTFALDPQGNPITDQVMRDLFEARMKAMGLELETKDFYMGEVKVQVYSPFRVIVDPTGGSWDEAKWAACIDYLDPDEVLVRWNKQIPADHVAQSPAINAPWEGDDNGSKKKSKVKVTTLYHLPGPACPGGRIVSFTKDQILSDEKWSYPFEGLPLVKFPGSMEPGEVYDSGFAKEAIGHQKTLNRALSAIVENANAAARPGYWIPANSIRKRVNMAPGEAVEYNAMNGAKPELREVPSLPQRLDDIISNSRMGIRDAFCVSDASPDNMPARVDSAQAIDVLQEMSTEAIIPVVEMLETALAQAGQMVLTLCQTYYTDPRLMKIGGSGSRERVMRFTQADIAGEISVGVEAGSGIPRLRAYRQMQAQQWVEQGILTPQQAARESGLASKYVLDKLAIHVEKAEREQEAVIKGEPLNADAYLDALEQLQQGVNPEDGSPLTDPQTGQPTLSQQQIEQLLEDAALKPTTAEDYTSHLETHGELINSAEFDELPPDIRKKLRKHFDNTMQANYQLKLMQEQKPVDTKLSLKAAPTPDEMVAILGQSGIQVSEEEAAEQPVDTWVSDAVDDPNQSPTAADAEAQKQAQQQQSAALQRQAQEAELHLANLRKAHAQADTAEAQAAAAKQGKGQ